MVYCSFIHSYKPIIRGCWEVMLVEDWWHLKLLFWCARFLVIEHDFWQNYFLFSILVTWASTFHNHCWAVIDHKIRFTLLNQLFKGSILATLSPHIALIFLLFIIFELIWDMWMGYSETIWVLKCILMRSLIMLIDLEWLMFLLFNLRIIHDEHIRFISRWCKCA